MSSPATVWLDRLAAIIPAQPLKIMNVCGGHERTITQAGLRSLLPANVQLIPGPGCPVCVCPEEDISAAIRIALAEPVTVVAFGDMLRVPINARPGEIRSLEEAKAAGADIRPIASPMEASALARSAPHRSVIFFAAGFETTMAPVAALFAQGGVPDNLFLLLSGRLTWPAVALLLASDTPGFDALIAPGHVATVMGAEEWAFVAERHGLPVAVAGFTPALLARAFYAVVEQIVAGTAQLSNTYTASVKPGGNSTAKRCLEEVFEVVEANWRGVGIIPRSGFALRSAWQGHDARLHFAQHIRQAAATLEGMPPGCQCAQVVLGRIAPNACRLYGSACTPRKPVGPCMVSEEGACHIWWAGGEHLRLTAKNITPTAPR